MVGAKYFASPTLSIAADYAPRKDLVARTMSLALRYQGPSGIGAQIRVGRLQNDTKYFIGATYDFGGSRRDAARELEGNDAEVQR